VAMLPQLTRSAASHLIERGKVTVNGTVITKSGFKLRKGDEITIDYDMDVAMEIPSIELPVLYEDDDCVVTNKPIGLLTHSKGAFNPEASVASWLGAKLAKDPKNKLLDLEKDVATGSPNNPRAGIVHRLDRATSGVMILAKTPDALTWLQKQFAQRKVKKIYMAVIEGEISPPEAVIDMPIERNPKKPQTFRVGGNGKHAITHYKTITTNQNYSLVELKPETGRTHQLRVHLAHQHHPILGDEFYDGHKADRLYLHALSLEITLPNKERKVFNAELPAEFQAIINSK
jgi:23S rRNA pseudouridine1911/1915/1917 synthase